MALTRRVAPGLPPVDLARLQAHMRLEAGEDDDHLQHCLDVAIAQFDGADGELGRALMDQTWRETFSAVPGNGQGVALTLLPVREIVQAEIRDAAGTWIAVDGVTLEDLEGGRSGAFAPSWGAPGHHHFPLRIDYVAGYGAVPGVVPLPICHAILLFAAHLYKAREPVSFEGTPVEVPLSIARLVAPFKSWWM
ncbi:head-tail connector protein [Pseudophaeobacter sp.]|uniref:head-tail connector protein n=1 Tax=Pseudophaeobacter sp. TaxID=1971739 RepID=UPI003A977CEC